MENNKEVLRHKSPVKRNVPLCCLLRETGAKQTPGPSRGLQWAAEDILIAKNHEEFTCNLPEGTRSTFLMVFSPDGKMVASTHGNHNVYVTDLRNGRSVKTLRGHPRTPWCIAFHPSSNQILASGCLGGQVRVWDLHGGSEIWTADSQTVIASLAFHPTDRVLVIASYNEIHFWDWSQQKPFAKCCTANEREKVRYVAFDGLGEKLVTGIANAPRIQSQWDRVSAPQPPPILSQAEHERRITICYRYMVEQYEQLVERYYRLSNSSPRRPPAQPPPAPSTTDRGTDPMVPADGDSTNRCILCRRTTALTTPSPPPGPSTSDRRHNHSTGTDEISASHSSSEFMPERSDSSLQGPLTMRATYLYERLARLRSQVETGRTILARTRSAAAAMSARMSPSAPEDANYLIDTAQTRPNAYVIDFNTNRNSLEQSPRFSLEEQTPLRSRSPPSHHYMLPEPLLPDEDEEERPSFISRISSFINRRRAARLSDSSSSDTSISDNVPTWQRPLTPPPPQSQRLTNLNCPSSRRVIFDQVETPPPPPPVLPTATRTPQNNSRRSLLLCNISGTSASTSLSSRSMSEPTNGSDSDADNVFLRQDMDNNFSHWRVFLRYRYFRDSGSNTEPPSESNSSDSNSSRLRRNSSESSSAIARLRAQFRRLQSVYNNRDREPHLLREAAENAERRLLSRLTNLLERPFPSTSSSTDSPSFQPPQGSSTDLASVRFGIELLGRHIENLSNQCSRVRLENSAIGMRRLWETLESQIFALHGAVRDWPPVVRVSPGNQVDTEGVASTSSLPTDEESEDSVSTQGRRHLGPRRFRFLHRPAYKRPRFDRNFRVPRRNNQGTSPDDDSDDNDEGGTASRQSESSDTDSRGVKRKSMCDPTPPAPPAPPPASASSPTPPLPSNDTTPRGSSRVSSRSRVTSRNYSRARSTFSIRPWLFSRERTSVLNPCYNTTREREAPPEGDFVASRTRSATSYHASRDALRHRARHVLLLMVDSLTQFFENDTFTRPVTNETLQQRITNLVSLLELALSLTDLLLTQLDVARETGNRRASRGQDSSGYRGREETVRRRTNTTRRFPSTVEDPTSFRPTRGEDIIPPGRLPPILRVNDGPVPPDPPPSATLRESPPLLPPTFRQRYLHPRYRMPILIDDSSEESSHDRSDLFFLRAHGSSVLLSDTPMAPHHRIQAWDFTKYNLPEIHLAHKNIVVSECKVHNDASVDISNDGKLLVTLLPSGRLSITTMLGVYSMQWESLGQCLYTTTFDQNAVSVSLSPTTRHLIVGLASRRVHFFHTDRQTIAQIFKMEGGKPSKSDPSKGRLVIVRELEMSRESTDFMSLNCIRWAPTPGEAFVYGTNTGKLKILR